VGAPGGRQSGTAHGSQGDPPAGENERTGGECKGPLAPPAEWPALRQGRADSQEAPDEKAKEVGEYI
jgi:hypothetical protein